MLLLRGITGTKANVSGNAPLRSARSRNDLDDSVSRVGDKTSDGALYEQESNNSNAVGPRSLETVFELEGQLQKRVKSDGAGAPVQQREALLRVTLAKPQLAAEISSDEDDEDMTTASGTLETEMFEADLSSDDEDDTLLVSLPDEEDTMIASLV